MTTKQELSDSKIKGINKQLGQHLQHIVDHGRQLEKLNERLTKLEGKVSSLDYTTSRRLLDLEKQIGGNEKALISNTGIAMAWAIFMTLALTGLFIWEMASAFSTYNARTVAHQVLPQ